MSGYNLPDGCNESDLPGSTPKDIAWGKILDKAALYVAKGQYTPDEVRTALGELNDEQVMEIARSSPYVRDALIELRALELEE